MADCFVGEIRMFAFSWPPRGWANCDGQLMAISQNGPLFSLLGTTYGGDGQTTFALPDMRGRTPVHAGSGPGLTPIKLGEQGGAETVTLTVDQLPAHNHQIKATEENATASDATNRILAHTINQSNGQDFPAYHSLTTLKAMNNAAVGNTGKTQPHNNMQISLVINFCIALSGIQPTRS